MLMKGKKAYVQAGAGIVADSVPESEYEESLNKTKALMRDIERMSAQMDREGALFRERLQSGEAREAFAAFAGRRKPDFSRA